MGGCYPRLSLEERQKSSSLVGQVLGHRKSFGDPCIGKVHFLKCRDIRIRILGTGPPFNIPLKFRTLVEKTKHFAGGDLGTVVGASQLLP